MADVLISSATLLEKLGREEKHLKDAGLNAHAQGVRNAIVALIRLTEETKQGITPAPAPSIEPSP
jgi:hypothetical protein